MIRATKTFDWENIKNSNAFIWKDDVLKFLKKLPETPLFDMVVTSPPYNIDKEYETRVSLDKYLSWQEEIIREISLRSSDTGSICWQVGNYVENGHIAPLDIEIHPIFKSLGYKLRNRIIWHFGHGLHSKRRFSGRYEVVLWYTKGEDYTFNLDNVRVASKYPGKKHYKGPNKGKYSGHPAGKNPEDVWSIPNVKSNHIEKAGHPCQFPVGLIERLVLALTNENDVVFDPFCGVGSAGVAALLHNRQFWGCEIMPEYAEIAKTRLQDTQKGNIKYRPHDIPIYDHTKSKLSIAPHRDNYNENTREDKAEKSAV